MLTTLGVGMSTDEINDVGSSWRKVVRILERDDRVTPRQRGFIVLAQPQGLIGSTLLVAVPNELTREVLQTQLKAPLEDALRDVFSGDILCAFHKAFPSYLLNFLSPRLGQCPVIHRL